MDIDRRRFIQSLAAGSLVYRARPAPAGEPESASGCGPGSHAAGVDALKRSFAHPPPEAGPGAYWYWLGGNVTREGITADLEAMLDVGIWTPMLFAIGRSGPDSPVHPSADALTPLWWELVEHAASEAARLGLVLSLNCCDGWATAAGPWITPELSMQRLVWSEQVVEGGKRVAAPLAQPPTTLNYYREIITIAVPHPAEWDETSFTQRAQVTTNLPVKVADVAQLSDPDNHVEVFDTEQNGWIDYQFEAPFTLRSIRVHTPSPPGYAPGVYRAANSLEVQASDDGTTYRHIGALEYPRHGWQTDLTTLTHALPQTTARYFRLVHRKLPTQPYEEEYDFGQDIRLRVFSIVLCSEPRIHHLQGKSGEQWALSRRTSDRDVPDESCARLRDIIKLDLGGDHSQWEAPPGRWRVLRIGYTTTGSKNSAAGGAQGLECDRFSAAAARLQFDSWFGRALQRVGPRLAGKVLHVLHIDSWEAGSQNWSPQFASGFKKLRGYDLLPYIAVLTGVPIESADVSERVLLDVRRTINDLTQREFFRTMTTLAHERGCLVSAEPPNPTFPADGFEHLAGVDWPMGEFWLNTPRNDKPTDIRDAVSGARLYGKKIAAAEAFTQGLMTWNEHPFTFKALGDRLYCEGINRFMLHVYAQQPWLDRAPGMTLNGIGTFFSRTQTWWKPGKAWFDYLRRCQALLQEGISVADVCYFTGENIPARALLPRQLSVAMPAGYAYDCINRDGLLSQCEVRDGWLTFKGGGRYRVLVLPDEPLLTPEIASRLKDLVHAGAIVVGPRPIHSPSLMGFPGADATVANVARELWGKGLVSWGVPLAQVLTSAGVSADIEIESPEVLWTHRAGPGWDSYFLSNQSNTSRPVTASFRIEGRRPELWHPDTGEIEPVAGWREEGGRIHLSLTLDPCGSVFVVFAKDAIPETRHNLVVSNLPAPILLSQPWTVRFNRGPELTLRELSSWTDQTDATVKYYSGTATYRTELNLPQLPECRVLLDLGEVHDLVDVKVNDQRIAVLWKPPFTADITAAVRMGTNLLVLEVTNTWRNRLIGDFGKPEAERQTFVVPNLRLGKQWLPGGPGTTLSPAGLLGPVRVRFEEKLTEGQPRR